MHSSIREVAIIGAGPAGIATAKHLLAEQHFNVIDVFEQQADVGGVWNYTSDVPTNELSVPQIDPHLPSEQPTWGQHEDSNDERSTPRFVTPMYDQLESNIPHFLMKYSDDSSLENQPLFAGHESVLRYLSRYADSVRHLVHFHTQVYDVKQEMADGRDRWLVCTKDLLSGKVSEKFYDAVVVASGHHYVPIVPEIRGIREWNKTYPGTISHSKYYRTPVSFRDKKVVVVGNSASGLDIAAQISTVSKHPIINSTRSHNPEYHNKAGWKQEAPEIEEFLPSSEGFQAVRFANGRVESSIEAIIFCTGYFYSFPFLSSIKPCLVVTGERVKHLYKHVFSIDHPSLAFVGLPYKIIPFRTCEGQAAVIARVWSERLQLPPDQEMRKWGAGRVADRGPGKKFHELGNLEDFRYHNDLVDWASRVDAHEGDRLPPRWNLKEAWVRRKIPAIKKAFAEKGEARHSVSNIEELGFHFDDDDEQLREVFPR
ncbi:MAG: hypothetical protein Q9220_004110 [cf. Caloplaca sp. 1 TL-2023]